MGHRLTTWLGLLLLASAAAMCPAALAQERTIRIVLSPEEADEVTFDGNRISESDVRRSMQLAQNRPYLHAEMYIRFGCFIEEPCSKSKETADIRKSRDELRKFQLQTRELDSMNYPPELSDVLHYVKRIRTFWVFLDERVLSFWENDGVSSLKIGVEGIDPQITCSSVLNEMQITHDRRKLLRLGSDWKNCMLKEGRERIGPYPVDAWKAFTQRYGIREHIISTEAE